MSVWPMWRHLQIVHNNASVCVCTHTRIYSLPHTHALGLSRCSSPHLFKNLSVIRTIQLFYGYGGQREGWLGRQWSAYSPSPSLFLHLSSNDRFFPSSKAISFLHNSWVSKMRGGGGAVCICGAGCLDLVVRTLAWVCLFCQAAIFRCLHTLCASVYIGTALRPAAICFQLECFWKSPCSCVFSSKTLIRHQREFPGLVFKLPCSGDCTKATLTQPLKLLCHKGDITMKCWWHHNAISIDSLEELDPE